MSETTTESKKAERIPLSADQIDGLKAELKRLQWTLESLGGANRLNERMKIYRVQKQLRDAGVATA